MDSALLTRRHTPQAGADGSLDRLVEVVNGHDHYTADHSCRVADYVSGLARLMNMSQTEIAVARRAALVHDIGKVAVPERILQKRGPLTEDEAKLVRMHPVVGAGLLSRITGLEMLVPIVLHHHERWDGLGYPRGLSGVDIPLQSRMIFVADAYDAMTTRRPYGPTLTPHEALAELRRSSGRQFDPLMVDKMHSAFMLGVLDPSPARRAVA
ncbi:MAG TPA: HD-GYP domain-containing protein [Actinomycetota bacterium]|jgi:putative nucleotidyltransferase with HDIG domain